MSGTRAFVAVVRKELKVWRRTPVGIVVVLLPPLLILGLLALAGASVSSEPTALVVQGHGSYSLQMAQDIQASSQFRVINVANISQAEELFKNLKVAAIVVIPASFDTNISQHKEATVNFTVNNVDADSTDDMRRGISVAVTNFDAMSNDSTGLNFQLSYLKPTAVSLLQFQSVGVIILLLLTTGLTGGSLAATREWENKTIRELLLSPESRVAMVLAKVISIVLTSFVPLFVVLAILIFGGYLAPATVSQWSAFILILVLAALFTSGLGVLLANLIKKGTIMIGLSINLSFLLFFLTGGLVAIPYLPGWAQLVSKFVPVTYATSGIDQTTLYSSLSQVGLDLVALSISVLLTLAACIYVSLTVGSRN